MSVVAKWRRSGIITLAVSSFAFLLLVIAGAGGAQAQAWKDCGQFRYKPDRVVVTEARDTGCKKAKQVARSFVTDYEAGRLDCPTAITCEVRGFTCQVDSRRDKIVCVRQRARVERVRFRVVNRPS